MNEKFKAKLEQAAEDYADLLLKRIESASKDMTADNVNKADEAFASFLLADSRPRAKMTRGCSSVQKSLFPGNLFGHNITIKKYL